MHSWGQKVAYKAQVKIQFHDWREVIDGYADQTDDIVEKRREAYDRLVSQLRSRRDELDRRLDEFSSANDETRNIKRSHLKNAVNELEHVLRAAAHELALEDPA